MFCDFCKCLGCQQGLDPYNWYAQADDGRWICDVCYDYEVCQEFPDRKGKGPCDIGVLCRHRPKLVSEWIQNPKDR